MTLAKVAACNPVANNQNVIGFLQELDRTLINEVSTLDLLTGASNRYAMDLRLTEESIERADHALLCAKNKGRNRVCTWDISRPD